MKLDTSVRFLFPTSPVTHDRFRSLLASMPRGAMSVTGPMPIGVVLLAPFYHPVLLAEQIGTLAAFAGGPLIVTFVLRGRPAQFQAFGMEERSRIGRFEETLAVVRALLAGERISHRGRYYTLENASISPVPRVPIEIW